MGQILAISECLSGCFIRSMCMKASAIVRSVFSSDLHM